MQLIKSLYCWHGFDNRQRFIFIMLSCLIAFIMLNLSLSNYKLSVSVILLVCSLTCLTTTRRRLNDAQLNSKWILAPAGSLLMTGLIIIFTSYGISYWLLLMPLFLSLLLLTYPSKRQKRYILGYNGPVNLSDFQPVNKANVHNNQRVEPTMNSINVNQPSVTQSHYSPYADSIENSSSTSHMNHSSANTQDKIELAESIRLALFSKKNARVTIAVIISLFMLVLVISLIFSRPSPTLSPIEQTSQVQETTSYQNKLTLPDNFSVMIAADEAIVIHWQADVINNREVWALGTAEGDKSCETIKFNDEEAIRTYSVSTADSGYYAYFSPLDTKRLIKNIAFKNSFALCGYNFSLKGSQATLGKSPFYANLIEY